MLDDIEILEDDIEILDDVSFLQNNNSIEILDFEDFDKNMKEKERVHLKRPYKIIGLGVVTCSVLLIILSFFLLI